MSFRKEIDEAVAELRNGGIILYPTDTIWGVGCDACNETAVRKVFALKKRPIEKTAVLLVSSVEMLGHYVTDIHPKIYTLHDYHTRPVTVIYDHPQNLPAIHIAAEGTVAIRIVQDEFCKGLIDALGAPIVSTSANIGGEPFPSNFAEITDAVKEGVDYIVKYRQTDLEEREPSVIIKLSDKEEFDFLRM